MTATQERPHVSAVHARLPRRNVQTVRRTAVALAASCLGVVPLKALFRDWDWLVEAWITMVIAVGPAMLIRLRRPAGALDVWPGIILLVPWLTWHFVPAHAYLDFLPTRTTLDDISHLMSKLHETTRTQVAPIHTTVPVRLVVCALLGLLAALVDLIAVVGRRGALAGVPLLVVFTVSGAVPRSSVAWPLFVIAAAAFLMLLALDAGSDLDTWGQRVHAPGASRGRTALAVSTQRIAAIAIAVAVALPLLVPGSARNLISEAFHGSSSHGIGGFGDNGTSGGISPFAALKGQLDRPTPVPLANVTILDRGPAQPFYLRLNVLSHFADKGWSLSSHGDTTRLEDTSFETDPPSGAVTSDTIQAQIAITGLTGNAPVFSLPTRIDGLDSGTTWSSRDLMLLGSKVHRGETYTEQFEQPAPTPAELRAAPDANGLDTYLQGASSVPAFVKDLVARITRNKGSAYDKARALSDYFANPANGFAYTLKTAPGDSGSVLVDFLKGKEGYCQQYAAAMAIMLRVAGVPSRVVLGYMHDNPDSRGRFAITTADAHAWVEAYFGGIGWIPFDTTPVTGLAGDAKSDLKWAPHAYGSAAAPRNSGSNRQGAASNKPLDPTTAKASGGSTVGGGGSNSSSSETVLWVLAGVVVIVLVVFVPAGVRLSRRRRRYSAIRSGDADALWAELTDTAVDLGYVWSRARSPRQVANWLTEDIGSNPALQAVTTAVERSRYSPDARAEDGPGLVGQLREVSGRLRATRTGGVRLRSALWPASLGWGGRVRIRRRR